MSVTHLCGDVIGRDEVMEQDFESIRNTVARPIDISNIRDKSGSDDDDDDRYRPPIIIEKQKQEDYSELFSDKETERIIDYLKLVPDFDFGVFKPKEVERILQLPTEQKRNIITLIFKNIVHMIDGLSTNTLCRLYENFLSRYFEPHIVKSIIETRVFKNLVGSTFWMVKWLLPKFSSGFSILAFISSFIMFMKIDGSIEKVIKPVYEETDSGGFNVSLDNIYDNNSSGEGWTLGEGLHNDSLDDDIRINRLEDEDDDSLKRSQFVLEPVDHDMSDNDEDTVSVESGEIV